MVSTDDNTFLDLLSNLDIEDSKQSKIVGYIGEFIILPIYESKLYEISKKYYDKF